MRERDSFRKSLIASGDAQLMLPNGRVHRRLRRRTFSRQQLMGGGSNARFNDVLGVNSRIYWEPLAMLDQD